MTRIVWNAPEERFFDAGLDRGVLYPKQTERLGVILGVNLVPNPSFEYGADGWSLYTAGSAGATSFDASPQAATYHGGFAANISASALGAGTSARVGIRSQPISVKSQAAYSASALFGGSLPSGKDFRIHVEMLDSEQNIIEGSSGSRTSVGRFSHQVYTTMSTAYIRVYLWMSGGTSSAAAEADFWIDAVQLVEGSDVPYFDGDQDGTASQSFYWSGTPGLSSSIYRERIGTAVAWNGLISVEEQGSEGSAEYYIDGRPFLYLPRPKEFKATLNAYTYPDAFAEMMGMAEVADGMYLDSQQSKAFDLCYRTKVGNGASGVDHGYKLHLVYNATVNPGNLSYESLSDSINPTTFTWEIQAVPVRVEGFRPTAHIVIDTRHMDEATIAAIERLVYGDEYTVAHMPTPQAIFDLLSFGDTIIVTDNGDGTFDVTGSYENVYMISEGVFRVDNVDGQDNGDGTFTISSTNE